MAPPTTDTSTPRTVPPTPWLPDPGDVPEDAVDAEIMAATLLSNMQTWAPKAVASGDFMGVADLRRRLGKVTIAIFRRNFSQSANLDAQNASRIADRALGLALHDAQKAGLVRGKRHQSRSAIKVKDVLGNSDRAPMYRLAVPQEEFDEAVRRARASGSLSITAVIAELPTPLTLDQEARRARIDELAEQGWSSRQISKELNIGAGTIRDLARKFNITIHADVVSRNTRLLDPARIVTEAIPTIDGVGAAAQQLDEEDIVKIDPAQAKEWARQLREALIPVLALQRTLRERGRKA